jgi:hypothetical protein
MMSLKPEPVSAIFLPVKLEQNIPFPLRLIIVTEDVDIVMFVFIVLKIISSFQLNTLQR